MNRHVYTNAKDFSAQNIELKTNLLYSEDISVLGEQVTVGSKAVQNRLACQAMEGCDGCFDGSPDELTFRRYKRLAEGGAGMIWFEATACREDGRANPRQLWIKKDNLDSFKRIVDSIREDAIKANGYAPLIIMQATHSGRYSKPDGSVKPLIAYSIPIFEKHNTIPSEAIVSDEYLDTVKEALVDGSLLAQKAGFDGVDIKCCHRYLNSELLSAYQREGRYGGSFENRTRLLRESIQGAIQKCSKDFIVTSRLNVYDGFEYPYGFGVSPNGGLDFDITEPNRLIKELYDCGVRILNITMGNPYFNPHVNRPFALGGYECDEHPLCGVARMLGGIAKLKEQNPDMLMISSALTYLGVAAPFVAAAYIKNGGFDFAGFGRTIFAYPDFAKDILNNGYIEKNKICICCSKCTHIMRQSGGTTGCVIRDKDVYMPIYKKLCKGEIK